jgi:hypothetical protein
MKLTDLLEATTYMRLTDFLESLDSKVEYDVISHSPSLYKVRSLINGREILVYFTLSNQSPDHWIFEFAESNVKSSSKSSTIKLTGSGGELKVFSLVKTVLLEFIELYYPEVIEFTADKSEGNRARLYARMLQKLNVPKYEIDHDDSYGDDSVFRLVREDRVGEP